MEAPQCLFLDIDPGDYLVFSDAPTDTHDLLKRIVETVLGLEEKNIQCILLSKTMVMVSWILKNIFYSDTI